MVQTSGTALSSGQRAQYAVPAIPCRSSLLDGEVASGDDQCLAGPGPGVY
jgi:hypothetical protein